MSNIRLGPILLTYLPVVNLPINEPIINSPVTSPATLSEAWYSDFV